MLLAFFFFFPVSPQKLPYWWSRSAVCSPSLASANILSRSPPRIFPGQREIANNIRLGQHPRIVKYYGAILTVRA